MTISHDIKAIFIHVQRTGGSSIINLLRKHIPMRYTILSQHGSFQNAEGDIIQKKPDYFVFGFVRNPWERMLSWYFLINKLNLLSLEKERKRFQKFLEFDFASDFKDDENTFHYNQLDYFPDLETIVNPIKICRFENYEEEVKEVFKRFGFIVDTIEISNETVPKNYRDYYTEKSIELVREKCSRDIEYFNYLF